MPCHAGEAHSARGWARVPLEKLRTAGEAGDAGAQLELARRYYAGEGMKEDDRAAAVWYGKAAEQGNATAQFRLAQCYYFGQGVATNYPLAARTMRSV